MNASRTRGWTLADFLLLRIEATVHDVRQHADPSVRQYVLAECEAKRRIVEGCSAVVAQSLGPATRHGRQVAETTLRHLASAYSDHPDYREEWKP